MVSEVEGTTLPQKLSTVYRLSTVCFYPLDPCQERKSNTKLTYVKTTYMTVVAWCLMHRKQNITFFHVIIIIIRKNIRKKKEEKSKNTEYVKFSMYSLFSSN